MHAIRLFPGKEESIRGANKFHTSQINKVRLTKKRNSKRKRDVFENDRMLRDQRDNLRNQVLQLRAKQEWAKIIQANIEAE